MVQRLQIFFLIYCQVWPCLFTLEGRYWGIWRLQDPCWWIPCSSLFSSLIKALIWSSYSFSFILSELGPSVEADGSEELQRQTDKFKTGSHRTHLKKQVEKSLKAGFGTLRSLQSCSYCRQYQGCFSISWKIITFRWEPLLRTGWVLATNIGMWQSGEPGTWQPWSAFLSDGRWVVFFIIFFLVGYLFPERCSLGGTKAILEFRPIPPNRTGENENTEMLKEVWFLIISDKVKGELREDDLEEEQVELSSFVKQSSRWEMWAYFYPVSCWKTCSSTNPESSAESSCCLGSLPVFCVLSCQYLHESEKGKSCLILQQVVERTSRFISQCRLHPLNKMRPAEDTQIQIPLSPRHRWLSRARIQILSYSLVSQLLVTVFLHSQPHVPVICQKCQMSPDLCWIWLVFGVRYPWTTLSPMPVSFSF